MGGGLAQLASFGTADVVLTGNPQITFFRLVYRRHTLFSIESIDNAFSGPVDFNKKATATLAKNGDLVHKVWLQVSLPDLAAYDVVPTPAEGQTIDVTTVLYQKTSDKSWWKDSAKTTYQVVWYSAGKYYTSSGLTTEIVTWPYMLADRSPAKDDVETEYTVPAQRVRWCNAVGYALMKSVEIEIGGQRIDKHYSEWWDIWSELSEKEERRAGLWAMVGKYDDAEYAATYLREQSAARTLYIPLTFCYNRVPGLSIPLVALQYNNVNFNIEFRPYMECIKSNVDCTALTAKSGGTAVTFDDCKLYVDYIYLDVEERRRFATIPHELLVEQLQFLGDESILASTLNRKVILNFTHPVKELVFVYTAATNYAADPKGGNSWFDYSMPDAPRTTNPFSTVKLLINGHDRFSTRPGDYFKRVQTYQHHTRVPSKNIMVYSFALNPEDMQPSGSCNFTRLDTAHLQLTMNSALKDGKIKIYAVSYNILRISSGLAGLAFSN